MVLSLALFKKKNCLQHRCQYLYYVYYNNIYSVHVVLIKLVTFFFRNRKLHIIAYIEIKKRSSVIYVHTSPLSCYKVTISFLLLDESLGTWQRRGSSLDKIVSFSNDVVADWAAKPISDRHSFPLIVPRKYPFMEGICRLLQTYYQLPVGCERLSCF